MRFGSVSTIFLIKIFFKNRPLEMTTNAFLISLFVLKLFAALTTGKQRHDNLIAEANGTNIQNLVFRLFQSHRQNDPMKVF